jgi:hypothetical protein
MHPDNKNLLITFGFQDNSAYLTTITEKFFEEIMDWKE